MLTPLEDRNVTRLKLEKSRNSGSVFQKKEANTHGKWQLQPNRSEMTDSFVACYILAQVLNYM
jgi:hypothetical protein